MKPHLSGERFSVVYRLTGDEADVRIKAESICIDQTIEFPLDLLPEGHIRDHIVGRIESLAPLDGQLWEAHISYAVENTGFELVQLLNAVFGVVGISPGVRLMRMDLPEVLLRAFKGPRFGRQGLRELLGVPDRPLIATALKPLGAAVEELAGLTYRFALGRHRHHQGRPHAGRPTLLPIRRASETLRRGRPAGKPRDRLPQYLRANRTGAR